MRQSAQHYTSHAEEEQISIVQTGNFRCQQGSNFPFTSPISPCYQSLNMASQTRRITRRSAKGATDNADAPTVEKTMMELTPTGRGPKLQGRANKAQATPPVESIAQPTTAKKKRGRPVGVGSEVENTDNPTNNAETAQLDSLQTPRLRVKRNPHPGVVDKGQIHRTKAQITQDRQHDKENKRRLKELEVEKKRLLANMLGAADEAETEQKRAFVRRISQVDGNNQHAVTDMEEQHPPRLSGSEFETESGNEPVVKRTVR
jgi:hypothetical protein